MMENQMLIALRVMAYSRNEYIEFYISLNYGDL